MPNYMKANFENIFIPQKIREYILYAEIFECSGESGAKTFFINKDVGYYLKIDKNTKLLREYKNASFLYNMELSAKPILYINEKDMDFLLSERLLGHTGIEKNELINNETICELFATGIKHLHSLNINEYENDKSIEYLYKNKTNHRILKKVQLNYSNNLYDEKLAEFVLSYNVANIKDKFTKIDLNMFYHFILKNIHLLKDEVFIHGDYCLPNIVICNGKFQGFLDVGDFRIGDRHIDLFWANYSIMRNFNNTDCLKSFYKIYGYEFINQTKLLLCCLINVFLV